MYDTADFQANDMCCACQGNVIEPGTVEPFTGACDTTDATDSYGDGCEWYDENPGSCGDYDTTEF